MQQEFLHVTERELKEIARLLAKTLRETQGAKARVVALKGPLGAGKTTFAKAFIRALSSLSRVSSPTFVLMKRHVLRTGQYRNVFHIDCYRVASAAEIRAIGWDDMIRDPKHIVLVEWPERITRLLPQNRIVVALEHDVPETRNIRITFA